MSLTRNLPISEDRSIVEHFREIAKLFEDKVAIRDSAHSITYGSLAALVDRIGAAVAAVGGQRPGPAAIFLPSDLRYPSAMLGALAAGRTILPLDADHPVERNRLIAAHSDAAIVISAGAYADIVRKLFPTDTTIIDIDNLGKASARETLKGIELNDAAYIVYTSGTSGTPKGVFRDSRGFLNSIAHYTEALGITHADRLSLVYSPSVVAALRDTFSALLNGASLHLLPPRQLLPAGLVREVNERKITIWHSVPTLFRHVVGALASNERLESIRMVNLAGERVDWRDYDLVKSACAPGAYLSVGLASTECPTFCHWLADPSVRDSSPRLPVGRPLVDRSVTIVDEAGQPLPHGEVGELVIASRYISGGYWGDPKLTAEFFTIDPANPEVRVFRSGDLGLLRPDGLIEFIGRKDDQIKLRGHRIEPGEIESALRACSGVRDAALTVDVENGVARSFAAYVELYPDVSGLLPRHLKAMLALALPSYMMPSRIVLVDELPRLPSFKIDRQRLKELDAARAESASTQADPVIEEVAKIFAMVIGRSGVTPEDNVNSLGGDSLQAVQIMVALEARFGVLLPSEDFETIQSIRELAAWIGSHIGKPNNAAGD